MDPLTTMSRTRHAEASGLRPVLSARWALTWKHLAVCLLFGGLFSYLNYRPLLDSQIWLHVHQGAWTLEHGSVFKADAAQPLTEGMDVIGHCWLSQVAFAWADSWGGPQYVSNLFALTVLGYFLVLARVFYLQTKRVGLMMAGLGCVLLLGRHFRALASPDVFGTFCFALLLWIVTWLSTSGFGPLLTSRTHAVDHSARGTWHLWLATAGLFAAWANLHPSYLLGIVVLACCALARAIEVGWETRSVVSLVSDGPTRRWVLLTEWAAAASLVNPYGLGLLLENLRLLQNEHLRQMPQWLPLQLPTPSGVLLLMSFALLAVVLRHSRRRVRPLDVLLLVAFATAMVPTSRGMAWYAPVFAFVLLPHVRDVVGRVFPAREPAASPPEETSPTPSSFAVSLVCALVVWCSFALSPISQDVLGGKPRKAEHLLGLQVPHGAAEYLREHPLPGLLFAPVQWANWLAAEGSPGVQVYMTSNVQWVPRRVWRDYTRIARAESGWQRALDRYAVQTVVVQKRQQESLRKAVEVSADWAVVFEDETAMIARREQ